MFGTRNNALWSTLIFEGCHGSVLMFWFTTIFHTKKQAVFRKNIRLLLFCVTQLPHALSGRVNMSGRCFLACAPLYGLRAFPWLYGAFLFFMIFPTIHAPGTCNGLYLVPFSEALRHSGLFADEIFHAFVWQKCAAGDHLADVITEFFEVCVLHVAVYEVGVVGYVFEAVAVDVNQRRDRLAVENLADDVEVRADCH